MADTFTWAVSSRSRGTTTGTVRRAQFGDGYSQTAADGINTVSRSWEISITGTAAVIDAVEAFLEAHIGISFQWAPPRRGLLLFQCDSFTSGSEGGLMHTLTATFQQTFQP